MLVAPAVPSLCPLFSRPAGKVMEKNPCGSKAGEYKGKLGTLWVHSTPGDLSPLLIRM